MQQMMQATGYAHCQVAEKKKARLPVGESGL
jgi:hypothetical protein